jgi:CheY-like chemotaxis protein
MEGRGRLTIEAGNALLDEAYASVQNLKAGQYVMLAVTDTGHGIKPEFLERVFEPFFSTKPEAKGTGLGLSMVYGFVKQSGGHIRIYSEVGEGTTVKIYLPRSLEGEDLLADTAQQPVRGGNETILVVEDDEDVREAAVEMLKDLGYRVLKAKDAASALTVIDSGVPVNLIFTDVVMPGPLRSPELARKAKERLPGVGVLFTSGYTENAIVHGGRLDPGVELLGKPYTREALARKIRQVLGNEAQYRLAEQHRAHAKKGTKESSPTRDATVLVVEDDELIRAATAEMLKDAGYVVLEAAEAREALAALGRERVDILVSDVGLPHVSGIDLAREARARQPDVRLVLATGDESVSSVAGDLGAVLLPKPFGPRELIGALERSDRRFKTA